MQEGAKSDRCPQFRSVLIEQFHCANINECVLWQYLLYEAAQAEGG